LLKLKEKGLIDLDVHPKKYLKEAEGFNQSVTIRHLLHHVSGLPDFEQQIEFCKQFDHGYPEETLTQLALLSKLPSYFEPNTNGLYANINFIIPALIIEKVTGQKYADYMAKEVFAPLGMKTAVVDNPTLYIENRVQGYQLKDGVRMPIEKSHDWLLGAGDIVGTVEDVYCLNLAYKNKRLLSEDTWKEIVTPSPINNMGLGNTILNWHGKLRINHNGGHYGFRTMHLQLPEDDFDVILMCNSGYGSPREDISEMIYQAFYGDNGALSDKLEMDKGYIK
jgi:CubicO group peptidase (beta-lactamase class C family)